MFLPTFTAAIFAGFLLFQPLLWANSASFKNWHLNLDVDGSALILEGELHKRQTFVPHDTQKFGRMCGRGHIKTESEVEAVLILELGTLAEKEFTPTPDATPETRCLLRGSLKLRCHAPCTLKAQNMTLNALSSRIIQKGWRLLGPQQSLTIQTLTGTLTLLR